VIQGVSVLVDGAREHASIFLGGLAVSVLTERITGSERARLGAWRHGRLGAERSVVSAFEDRIISELVNRLRARSYATPSRCLWEGRIVVSRHNSIFRGKARLDLVLRDMLSSVLKERLRLVFVGWLVVA